MIDLCLIIPVGDGRVNKQVELTVMHTVFMSLHNLIARELHRLNPHWKDTIIYQEARRTVNAMFQHIVYNEWLPIILGYTLTPQIITFYVS